MKRPSTNGDNGRDGSGRFTAGNAFGTGNPFARKTARLRQLILDSVTDDDLVAVVHSLVEQAKAGDLGATKLLLGYLVGSAPAAQDPDQLNLAEVQTSNKLATCLHTQKMNAVFDKY
jgi:hypothetical protein